MRPLRLLSIALAGLWLAACTITSDHGLTGDGEAATPLPDAFAYFRYERTPDGYLPAKAPPVHFARTGAVYASTDAPDVNGPLDVRFVRLDDDLYLLAATLGTAPATTYGFARYDDGVLAIAFSPDRETAAALRRERIRVMPQERAELAGLSIARGTDAITLRSRAALDDIARLYAAGSLPMAPPAVGYISLDPTSPPPSRLVASAGHDWIEVP